HDAAERRGTGYSDYAPRAARRGGRPGPYRDELQRHHLDRHRARRQPARPRATVGDDDRRVTGEWRRHIRRPEYRPARAQLHPRGGQRPAVERREQTLQRRRALMRCPRCTLAELPEATETCWLCGYSSAVATAEEAPPPPPTPTELDARRELGRDFRIESLLERPPGPIVYLARDAEDRLVALKVLPRAEAGAAAERFDAAARATAQLDHPHIIPVYSHGATENFLWCATKYVDGRSLASMLQTGGPLEHSACLRIFEQVASGLDYAHR